MDTARNNTDTVRGRVRTAFLDVNAGIQLYRNIILRIGP